MAETFRIAKVEKLAEWMKELSKQSWEEASAIESKTGLLDPHGITLRARALAYDSVITKITHEFFSDDIDLELEKTEEPSPITAVKLIAFTGMEIAGIHAVIRQDKDTIEVVTKKGILTFDKATGIQMDAKNPRFANRFIRVG